MAESVGPIFTCANAPGGKNGGQCNCKPCGEAIDSEWWGHKPRLSIATAILPCQDEIISSMFLTGKGQAEGADSATGKSVFITK